MSRRPERFPVLALAIAAAFATSATVAGCAQGTEDDSPADDDPIRPDSTTFPIDAPQLIDAPQPVIDAPPQMVDAPPQMIDASIPPDGNGLFCSTTADCNMGTCCLLAICVPGTEVIPGVCLPDS